MHRRSTLSVLASTALLTLSQFGLANSGVQLPLDQFQAGTESTTAGPITNAGFEQPGVAGPNATGWTPVTNGVTPVMSVGAPDAANLPSNPSVLGSFVAKAGLANRNFNDWYEQGVTLAPDTDYVLSAYIWNYGLPGPAPSNDFFAGDLAVVQLRDTQNFLNTAGVILEPVRFDNGSGSRGVFVYKTFNSAQFANGATLEVMSDPNEDISGARPSVIAQFDNIAITPVSTFKAQAWTSATSGNWGDDAKWVNKHPNFAGAVATFSNVAGPVTVTLDAAKQVSAIKFDSNGAYTIAGTNSLTLNHDEDRSPVVLMSLRGNHTISTPVIIGEPSANGLANIGPRIVRVSVAENSTLTVSGSMTSSGASQFDVIMDNGFGTFQTKNVRARQLFINDGTLKILAGASPDSTSKVKKLFLNDGGHLDISNSVFIVDYDAADPSPIAQYRIEAAGGAIKAGSPANNLTVGFVEASSLSGSTQYGQTVDSTAVLMISTFKGDSNIDRDVDFDDLLTLAQNYGSASASFAQGDNNYDGNVNFDDLLALAQNYGATFSLVGLPAGWSPTGSFDGDWALAQSLAPEPASIGVIALGATLARRRR